MKWMNPYADTRGQWLKGSLHAHTAPVSPCAVISQDEILGLYRAAHYDFLSLSDHLSVTRAQDEDMLLIPGLEWNSRIGHIPDTAVTHQHHTGLYAPEHELLEPCLAHRSHETLLPAVAGRDVLLVANHPCWEMDGHYDLADLLRLQGAVACMEIYNGVIDGHEGQADATPLWDRLLSAGRPMIGLASDDAHRAGDVGKAWIMVRAQERTAKAVLEAVAQGNLYGSTGVTLLDVGREGDTLFLRLAEPARVTVIGQGGRTLVRDVTDALEWDFSQSDTPYARLEVMDSQWRQAWSQPFFREGE